MIRIRPIQEQDFEQLTRIEFESFTDPYSEELFQFLAGTQPDQFLVAVDRKDEAESILGYAVADIDRKKQSKVGHTLSIAIGIQYRRRGFGSRLLSKLINVLKSKGCNGVVLEVRVSNNAAQSFYQKLGFREVKRRRRFYDDGEDALVMALNLEEGS